MIELLIFIALLAVVLDFFQWKRSQEIYAHGCVLPDNGYCVYIASPFTKGDQIANIKRQVVAANKLIDAGFTVYAPLVMSSLIHADKPRSWKEWMEIDKKWVEKCDITLRLPGESKGADAETEYSEKIGNAIFYNEDILIATIKPK